jgi:hypothetical protein
VWGFWTTLGFTLLITTVYMALQVKLALAIFSLTDPTAMTMENGHVKYAGDVTEALSNGFIVSLTIIVAAPICTVLTAAAAFLKRGLPIREYFALKSAPMRQAAIWLLASTALVLLYDQVQSRLFDLPDVPGFMLDVYTTAGSLPLLYVSFVLFAPLFEEALFRGFMFKGIMDSAVGPVGAVLVTTVLWTVIHFQYDLYVLSNIFFLGILIGAARLKTGSIGIPYAMHAVNNLMALAVTGLHVNGP